MRNFPKLQLSIFYLQFSKNNPVICGGDSAGKISRYTTQINSLTHVYWHTVSCKQTRKIHDQACTRLRILYAHMLMLIKILIENRGLHKVLLKVKTSHLWEYLKSYKSIKRTAQLKTFKLTLQQLFHCSNKKYQTMFHGKWKQRNYKIGISNTMAYQIIWRDVTRTVSNSCK